MKNVFKRILKVMSAVGAVLVRPSSIEGLFALFALAAMFYGIFKIYEPAAFVVCGALVWHHVMKED